MSDPVTIKILILSDGRLSDASEKLGLERLTGILREDWGGSFRFDVTRKHINDYRREDLTRILNKTLYQEAWLFGDNLPFGCTSPRPEEKPAERPLNPATELPHLSDFMRSAGVFATGDHRNLGGALNGSTVRISKMRKWIFQPDRTNPLNAPPRNGPRRHDTLRHPLGAGSHTPYVSKFQEDDVPQIIEPVLFATSEHSPLRLYPHPLLSNSTAGAIRLLPDHMHEGECHVSSDLPELEFPSGRGGVRPLPVIVAKSRIEESHSTTDNYPGGTIGDSSRNITDARGLICAYDGHPVLRGRAVTGSTFHHFLDFNVKGFAESRDRTSPDRGQHAYEEIKTFYRNIALWLAPPRYQQRIFERVLMDVISSVELRSSAASGWADLVSIGTAIRVLAGRLVSPSFVLQWMLELVDEVGGEDVSALLVNPWLPQAGGPIQGLLDTEVVISALVGGVALSLADEGNRHSLETADGEPATGTAIRSGVDQVVKQFLSFAGGRFAESGRSESSKESVRESDPKTARSYVEGYRAPKTNESLLTIPKGDSAMSTIWYEGLWKLDVREGEVWSMRIFLVPQEEIGFQPYVQLAPCNDPSSVCSYSTLRPVFGPNPAPEHDVSISFCTTILEHRKWTNYCFLIDFHYRRDPDFQRLRYRFLGLGYATDEDGRALALSETDIDEDGSGTGTRVPITKSNTTTIVDGTEAIGPPPLPRQPPAAVDRGSRTGARSPVAGRPSASIDDGSGHGTHPPTTVEP